MRIKWQWITEWRRTNEGYHKRTNFTNHHNITWDKFDSRILEGASSVSNQGYAVTDRSRLNTEGNRNNRQLSREAEVQRTDNQSLSSIGVPSHRSTAKRKLNYVKNTVTSFMVAGIVNYKYTNYWPKHSKLRKVVPYIVTIPNEVAQIAAEISGITLTLKVITQLEIKEPLNLQIGKSKVLNYPEPSIKIINTPSQTTHSVGQPQGAQKINTKIRQNKSHWTGSLIVKVKKHICYVLHKTKRSVWSLHIKNQGGKNIPST